MSTQFEMATETVRSLETAGLELADVRRIVDTALAEDLRYGPDLTTEATVGEGKIAFAEVNSRQSGVLSGIPIALSVLDAVLGPDGYVVQHLGADGQRVEPGMCVLRLRAPVRGLLTAERTMLNLLCHSSGIASATARWVSEVDGTACRIRDSRKTLPGLRSVQKYAVRCGGGVNHRFGLGDAMLIKDNHVVAAGSVAAALRACRAAAPTVPCEVEVGDLDEFDEVLAEHPELVLLDNFTPRQCAEAVRRLGRESGVALEASGGLTLDAARSYAETGVHYLAVGGLTHSAPALDLGLDTGD